MLSRGKLAMCFLYVLIRPRRRALFDPVWGILCDDALKLGLVLFMCSVLGTKDLGVGPTGATICYVLLFDALSLGAIYSYMHDDAL